MNGFLTRADHNEDRHLPWTGQLAPFLLRHCYPSTFSTSLPVLGEHVVYCILPLSTFSTQFHTPSAKEITHAEFFSVTLHAKCNLV